MSEQPAIQDGAPLQTGKKATELKRDERRAATLRMVLGGYSYRFIAGQLGVSVATVANDMAANERDLAKQYLGSAKRQIAKQVRRLDVLLSAVWPDAVQGHGPSIDRARMLIMDESRLQGLDKVVLDDETLEVLRAAVEYVQVEVVKPDNSAALDAEYEELLGLESGKTNDV